MTDEQLAAIKARLEAATPGPWGWFGYLKQQRIELIAAEGLGLYVMQFGRWGFQRAQPVFRNDMRGIMESVESFTKAKEYGSQEILDIDHPDAQLIKHAPTDIKALLEDNERLRAEIAALKEGVRV